MAQVLGCLDAVDKDHRHIGCGVVAAGPKLCHREEVEGFDVVVEVTGDYFSSTLPVHLSRLIGQYTFGLL